VSKTTFDLSPDMLIGTAGGLREHIARVSIGTFEDAMDAAARSNNAPALNV
jgi:hypothetical protein